MPAADVTAIVASIIAFVGSFIGPVLTSRLLASDKAQRDTAFENLQTSNRLFEKRLDTEYSWLHQHRAGAMSEIYTLLMDVEDAFNSLLRLNDSNQYSEWLRDRIDDAFGKFTNARNEYLKRYRPLRLLLPAEIGRQLDALTSEYESAIQCFSEGGADSVEHDGQVQYLWDTFEALEALGKMSRPQTAPLLKALEDDFRKIYGSDEP